MENKVMESARGGPRFKKGERTGFARSVTYEWRPERGEGASHVGSDGRGFRHK